MTPQMEEQMMAGILAYRIEVRQLQQERDRKRKELEEQRKHSEEALLLLECNKLRAEIEEMQCQIAAEAVEAANTRTAIQPHVGRLVLAVVGKEFGVSVAEMVGPCRKARLSLPRSVVALLLQERGWSLLKTGRLLNRHHTSIMYAVGAVKGKVEKVPELGSLIETLRAQIDARREDTWDVQ